MEECVGLGLTKSIGVSNFNSEQIERLLKVATVKPVTNQVLLFSHSSTALVGLGLLNEVSQAHSVKHTIPGRTHLDKRSACCRDQYLKAQHSNRHLCPRWDLNPQSKETAADPRLRLHSHWDQRHSLLKTLHNQFLQLIYQKLFFFNLTCHKLGL
jgi:hypothetical protein